MNPREVIHKSWEQIIFAELYKQPLHELNENILPNISFQPSKENIFNVFKMPVNDIKVVILGEDPYPIPGNAIGKAFAVNENAKIPASLRIIREEITNNIPIEGESLVDKMKPMQWLNNTGLSTEWQTLQHWSKQGIFLLNTALTVETGKAGSHLKYWGEFTKRIVTFISHTRPCIWVLWGAKAQKYKSFISNQFPVQGYDQNTIKEIPGNDMYNYILTAPHPSTEVYLEGKAGFYGCNHFLFINEILNKTKQNPINW